MIDDAKMRNYPAFLTIPQNQHLVPQLDQGQEMACDSHHNSSPQHSCSMSS
uniref:Uncharacterized protein n=1 Tax=Arundo donax TaxID=35708 RepID=A0A0A9D8G9_ARUDO